MTYQILDWRQRLKHNVTLKLRLRGKHGGRRWFSNDWPFDGMAWSLMETGLGNVTSLISGRSDRDYDHPSLRISFFMDFPCRDLIINDMGYGEMM